MDGITIYGELFSSKNSKRIISLSRGTKKNRNQKHILVPSKAFTDSEDNLYRQFVNYKYQPFWNQLQNLAINKEPIVLLLKSYRKTKRKFDYNNIFQGFFDIAVKSKRLMDDNADILIPVYYPYSVDKDNPRTIISAMPYKDYVDFLNKYI